MSQNLLFGVETVSLTDAVETFMAMQGNVKRNHFIQYMVTGKTVWEKMFRESIWATKQKKVDVETDSHGKKTFRLPGNMFRMLSISGVDKHGNIQPFSVDENMNTLEIKCHSKTCSCKNCEGKNTYCDALDTIGLTYRSLVVDGQTYEVPVWTKKVGCDIIEYQKIPVKQGDAIVYIEQTKTICDLEVDTVGCIKATEPNREKLLNYFGWYPNCFCNNFFNVVVGPNEPQLNCRYDLAAPQTINHYGYYKPDADDPQKIHLNHTKAEQVIVFYQLKGAVGEDGELRIPEYAKECFYYGMNHFIKAFDNVTPAGMKVLAASNYNIAERALNFIMNPIRMKEFLALPGINIKWGGA